MNEHRRYLAPVLCFLVALAAAQGAWEIIRINTDTGEVRPSGVGGITYNGAPASSAAPSNALTLKIYCDPNMAYGAGVLHVYCWRNANLTGFTAWKTAVTNVDIRRNTYYEMTLTNSSVFAGSTWWYAWFDADGDGFLNYNGGLGGDWDDVGVEPAAMAEHMPLVMNTTTEAGTVAFWMVLEKGATPRFIKSVDESPNGANFQYDAAIRDSVGTIRHMSTSYGRKAILEPDYLRDTLSTGSKGGWAWNLAYDGATIQTLFQSTTWRTCDYGIGASGSPANANNANAPTAYYPSGGATVAVDAVEFKLTDAWTDYSSLALQCRYGATNGTLHYTYNGYMENEHWDDGTVRHKAPTGTFDSGSSYWWRARCVFAVTNSTTYKPTAWSSWASFTYTNAP
jgi:hypothetical protein